MTCRCSTYIYDFLLLLLYLMMMTWKSPLARLRYSCGWFYRTFLGLSMKSAIISTTVKWKRTAMLLSNTHLPLSLSHTSFFFFIFSSFMGPSNFDHFLNHFILSLSIVSRVINTHTSKEFFFQHISVKWQNVCSFVIIVLSTASTWKWKFPICLFCKKMLPIKPCKYEWSFT